MRYLLAVAVLAATPAFAADDYAAALASTTTAPATYTAGSAGASLTLHCTNAIRYAAGSAAAAPTAGSTGMLLDFVKDPSRKEIQLSATQDRVSVIGWSGGAANGFACKVYVRPPASDGGPALVTLTGSNVPTGPDGGVVPVELPLLSRLNGEPVYLGTGVPGADGGVSAYLDAGINQVVQVQCTTPTLQIPGGTVATNGVPVAANTSAFYVLTTHAHVTVRAADAGISYCPFWIMQ